MAAPRRPIVLAWLDPARTDDDTPTLLAEVPADLLVAQWDPNVADAGRTDLLASVRDARDRIVAQGGNPDELTVIGFGLGAVAAAGLARYARRLGIGLGRVIAVAGAWDEPDPFSGSPIEDIPERVELVDRADQLAAILD